MNWPSVGSASDGDLALRTAYLFLRDRALAEDCVQDAFISAWKARFSSSATLERSEVGS